MDMHGSINILFIKKIQLSENTQKKFELSAAAI